MSSGLDLMVEPGQTVPRQKELATLALHVARGESLRGRVNLVFCSNERVRQLNRDFRHLDKVTDVLSFVWDEPDFAGEVYVAAAQVKMQAPRWNNNYFNELRRVVVHGMLHICGYDHQKLKERKIMREKEDFYLKARKTVKKATNSRWKQGF